MKNLLIGYFYNVKSFEGIKAFIKSIYSLEDKSFDAVLLDASDDDSSYEVVRFAKRHKISVIKIKKETDSLYIDRFRAYKEYFADKGYEKIILSDCTDVYLQRDPFLDLVGLENELVLSSENVYIGDVKWNYDIIKNVYNEQIANKFVKKQVINSGIIAGDALSVEAICDLIVYEHSQKRRCFTGADQGILMKIIYSEEFPNNYRFASHSFSLMLAVGFGFTDKIINNYGINIDGITITDNYDNKYAIIHQYNRKSTFNEKVVEHFQ